VVIAVVAVDREAMIPIAVDADRGINPAS